MFYALNDSNTRVLIDDADKKLNYHCPCCDFPVIVKKGQVNAWHYAHRPGSQCDAAYSEKTEWHRRWQEIFPEECREVVVQDITGYKRIADVKVGGLTIEFQSKSIPKDVFDARNRHHIRAASQIVWVFDCRDKDIYAAGKAHEFDGSFDNKYWYCWTHPNRMLAQYRYLTWVKPTKMLDKQTYETFKNVTIYLQCTEDQLVKVLYVNPQRNNMGSFLGKPISCEAFISGIKRKYMQPSQTRMIV